MITFRSFLLRMRDVWDKICGENQNPHFVCSKVFVLKSCHLWEKMEKYCRAEQATDDSMVRAHGMLDTYGYKYTPWVCVILIAFPLQQWLHESTSMLCYACISCLVVLEIINAVKNIGKLQVRMVQSRYLQTKFRKYTATVEPGFQIRGTLNLRKNPCYWTCWVILCVWRLKLQIPVFTVKSCFLLLGTCKLPSDQ